MNWKKNIWVPLLITALASALGLALYNVVPTFWNTIVDFVIPFSVIWILLFVHNLFYHATFLWIECLYFYATDNKEGALRTLNLIQKE